MLSKRIIACLDVRDGSVVKGINFEGLRRAGDPAELAERYNAEGIDELVILDVTATIEGRRALEATIREVSSRLFIPLAVGGGIRAESDAAAAIDAGADKVSINSAALADPALVTTLAERYGSQAVVVAIDAKQNGDRFEVFARSGKVAANRDAVEWAVEAEARGAGEILLTSIDRDGTRAGFDCPLTAAVSSAVSIPVIASGGAGTFDHFLDVFTGGKADAALAASIFHYSEHAVAELKQFLQRARRAHATLMLIPSIDLQGGRIVQLVQGEQLAVETNDVEGWIERFSGYPKVQLIDLDAAKNAGANEALIATICARLPCRVGGGIRTPERAQALVGARGHGSHPRVFSLQERRGRRRVRAADRRRRHARPLHRRGRQPRRPRRRRRLANDARR